MELTHERIIGLLKAEAKLNALEEHGVDNWEGWDDAMATYRTYKEEIENSKT